MNECPARIRLASRESPLALRQARMVAAAIGERFPATAVDILTFKTTGDRFLEARLSEIGDKGLFVKELEEALLDGRADLAVHSLKDMPARLPEGLLLSSGLAREDARDVWLASNNQPFFAIPAGAVIGTASLRRMAQLRRLRPDLRFEVIRGNVQTRYRKLAEGQYDAIVLAAAGLHRMSVEEPEWRGRISGYFAPAEVLPAAGQGILALEYRTGDAAIENAVRQLRDGPTETAMRAERAFLARLEGGCQVPMGGYCTAEGNEYELSGIVLSAEGSEAISGQVAVDPRKPEDAGISLADDLLARGAARLLNPA